ncbi:MAG: hypothetical protein ACRDQ4_08020 [Pseudonocardiaceae bacterium]
MPIHVRIEGSPESIRAAARWLTSKLQPALYDCASQVYKCRTNAEAGWQGEASSGFQGKMTAGGQGADTVADDALRLGQSFHQYADGLYTAQAGMQRARDIAVQGGLQVTDTEILDPVPEQQDYQQKVAVFNQAVEEVDRANGILDGVQKTAEDYWKDLSGKRYIHAAEFTNGVADDLIMLHKSILKKESARLLDEAKVAESRYLSSPGGSAEAKLYEEMRLAKTMGAADLEAEAASIGRRLGSRIPIIGWGITAAGIGYDIHEGQPPGKAIFSGVAGAAGAIMAASMVGGPVGVAAGVGVVAGIAVGLGADWVYDHVVPDGVKRKIDEGLAAVGHGIADAGEAVGNMAKKIWDSIF